MESGQKTCDIILKAEFCLCNDVQHYFLSDPVIVFDCCCPEVVPTGVFSMSIPGKPPILHFKSPLTYDEICEHVPDFSSFKSFQSTENFILNYHSDTQNESDVKPDIQLLPSVNYEGKECIEECMEHFKSGQYPPEMDHTDDSYNDLLEIIAEDLEPDFARQLKLDSNSPNCFTPESGPKFEAADTDEEKIMKLMDFIFRDVEPHQLDQILENLSKNEVTG